MCRFRLSAKAYTAGIVQGVGEGRFAPDNPITRQEIMVMFYRIIGKIKPDADLTLGADTVFADHKDIAPWAEAAVRYEFSIGIIKGTGNYEINPLGFTTREQAVAITLRSYGLL